MDIVEIVERQRAFFSSGGGLSVPRRLELLKKLKAAISENEAEIARALKADLNKSPHEAYLTEIGMVLDELSFAIRHLKRWARPRGVKTPVVQFSARSLVYPEPYGLALIMSPWNYPFQLTIAPLCGAVAAGNCVVVKPSAYAPETSRVMKKLVESVFPPELACVIEGGREENRLLLEQKFDYIFFTGSVEVGKYVMERASRFLTPVSLELGGKSPVIVDETANISLAAKRIAFGKYINAGQTCVAPDYLLIHRSVKDSFIAHFKAAVADFYPNSDFSQMPCIVNSRHYERLMGLIDTEKVVLGGVGEPNRRFIAPTVMDNVSWDDPIMGEEIFGPVLPIITYDNLDRALEQVIARPKPLALYLFTSKKEVEDKVLRRVSFGGGCINDTIMHLVTPYMGFGGVGDSGMGAYHGRLSFDTFSHYKSILKKHTFVDLKVRYMPYNEKKLRLIRRLMR